MTPQQIKDIQDSLVKQGYMTQAQVNTGYGTYGPQTTAAMAKHDEAAKAALAATSSATDTGAGQPFSNADQAAALASATSETQPYYTAEQANATTNAQLDLANQQAQYGAYQNQQASQFQQDKTNQDQAAANQGVLFSGGRAQKLSNLQNTYTNDQASKLSSLGANVGQTANNFQYKYGNDAANALSKYYQAPTNTYNANMAQGGAQQGGLSSVYNPNANNFQGTEINAAKSAAQTRAAGLLANKGNKILPYGYQNKL